ncbi:hypothetical protein EV586_105292 [Tumebacillus sp. BK434]|uniref:DUF1292 domain-containing protein n=1 Tax=Tumebacillus sp. BK434 TaxID=2512169 RepID=UPI0010530D1F|nr:DUF1292 domain-containing protein [Tumebacillus sp. BK434]TCP53946.1 hypothetical protein EV586_105292 [Tumebacillus sp. BK434]
MRNEIGFMEDKLEVITGQQLHLEVPEQGVYDYEAAKVFAAAGVSYILCLRLSPGREAYLLKADDLGEGWWNIIDIEDDSEWERARQASGYQDFTGVLHR